MELSSNRKYVYFAIFGFITLAFIVKLYILQVPDNSYKKYADMYTIRRIVKHPARGNILDRNGKLVVSNEYAYDVMMVPSEAQPIDTADFCETAGISYEEYVTITSGIWNRIKEKKQSKSEPVAIAKTLTKDEMSAIQEKMYKYPGYFIDKKALRNYKRPIAALILGEVGEVDTSVTNHNPYYKPGDYIGRSGIEKSYEEILRGTKGVKKVFVDVHNNEKGSYLDGAEDSLSVQGEDLTITIDAILQEYAEQLMQNKKGAIVAIEPKTGEILALVSAPTYDPNLLVGQNRRRNYPTLLLDPDKPLYNRAIMDGYPPGSTFKVLEALAGQQEQVIFPNTTIPCGGGFRLSATKRVGCHSHATADLRFSITTSCNAYYCSVFNMMVKKYKKTDEGYEKWREYVVNFGFGQNFPESDIPNIKKGNVPTVDYYNRIYGKNGWKGLTVISLGIGQGELKANALQIANLACVVANRGYYVTPHVGKKVGDIPISKMKFSKHEVGVDDKYFDIVQYGMYGAVHLPGGTASRARLEGVEMCGKTGTAQNSHGKDHSVFMCYAPKDNPKIAIGILVENAGFGATWAAPIASLMIEKYLNGEIKRKDLERTMFEGNLLK